MINKYARSSVMYISTKSRKLGGQQITYQLYPDFLIVMLITINCHLGQKNPHILALKFEHFPIS